MLLPGEALMLPLLLAEVYEEVRLDGLAMGLAGCKALLVPALLNPTAIPPPDSKEATFGLLGDTA
jgi:hypothetical protein